MSHAQNLSGHIILTGDSASCLRVLNALRVVIDAEVARNIVDLGLVNSVHAEPGMIEVVLLSSCSTCHMGNVMDDAFVAVRAMAPADTDIFVLPADPQTWTPLRLSSDSVRRARCE